MAVSCFKIIQGGVGWGWENELGRPPLKVGDRYVGVHYTSLPTSIYLRFSKIKSRKWRFIPTKTHFIYQILLLLSRNKKQHIFQMLTVLRPASPAVALEWTVLLKVERVYHLPPDLVKLHVLFCKPGAGPEMLHIAPALRDAARLWVMHWGARQWTRRQPASLPKGRSQLSFLDIASLGTRRAPTLPCSGERSPHPFAPLCHYSLSGNPQNRGQYRNKRIPAIRSGFFQGQPWTSKLIK